MGRLRGLLCALSLCAGVVAFGAADGQAASQAPTQATGGSPCSVYASGTITDSKLLAGTGTRRLFDRNASIYQVCSGFGAPDTSGFHLTAGMQCALVAAAATYAGPPLTMGIDHVCSAQGIASAFADGGWLNGLKQTVESTACGWFSDVFAGGAALFAAGATSETGPGAVAVGVGTWKALTAGMRLVCGGLLTGPPSELGVKLEAHHETQVMLDIIHKGKCLEQTRKPVIGLQWFAVTCPGTTAAPISATTAALQACTDRFNWMNFSGWYGLSPVPARVQASPCRVTIAYGTSAAEQSLSFPCVLDSYGAYSCASHAVGQMNGPPLQGANATYYGKSGVLRLTTPGRVGAAPKPDWMKEYPVDHGFIVPFDSQGKLRPGLTLIDSTWDFNCTTSTNTPWRTELISCPASATCFVPTVPSYVGELAVCPTAPGSRTFRKTHLHSFP